MDQGKYLARWVLCLILLCGWFPITSAQAVAQELACDQPGWFPEDFGLKDHSVFLYDGYTYIISNYIFGENKFAYARSLDLCNWEVLEPVLKNRSPGTWDEKAIWSPYVFEENGVYFIYFTGVTQEFTQSILLATSQNPADPASWEMQEMVFQPDHAGSTWEELRWADCRDPMLIKEGEVYYLYYSAYDEAGGIIGVATSENPYGGWTDWGSIIPPIPGVVPESATVFSHENFFYLFYHLPSQPENYRVGASLTGPWLEAQVIGPGWAHEVWVGMDGFTYTSYLTDYSVSISPLIWNPFSHPPRPFIGEEYHRTLIPIAMR